MRVAWVSVDTAGARLPVFAAFRAGMADLGLVEGRNPVIDTWWGEGSLERLTGKRDDMLRSQPGPRIAWVWTTTTADGSQWSCGAGDQEQFRQAAGCVYRVLNGARIADMPTRQPTESGLLINRTATARLGLSMSCAPMLQADEVTR